MRHCFLILFLVLNLNIIYSQTWNRDYGNYNIGWADISKNVEVYNDSIFIQFSDQNPNAGRRLNIMNLNQNNGDVIWIKTYALDSVGMNGGAYNSADGPNSTGKFVLAQHFETGDEDLNEIDLGQLVIFNQYFDTLHTSLKGDSLDAYIFHQAKVLSDDNFVAVGWTDASFSGLSNTLLVKYNEYGEELWSTVHSAIQNYRNQVFSVTELGNSNIVTGGFTGTIPNQTEYQILTMFDEDGVYLDHRLFGDEDWIATEWARVDPTIDGNIIVSSSFISSEDGDKYYYISKIDSNLNSIWEKYHYSGTSETSIHQVKETEDGGYIGVGTWVEPPTAHMFGFMMKFDSEGEVMWERKYQHADEGNFQLNQLYDIEEIPEGNGYVACGQRNETDTGQNAWVIKVDSMGCLIPGCDTLTHINELTQQVKLLIYPNPAINEIYVKVPDLSLLGNESSSVFIKLYNLQGKEVQHHKVGRFEATYLLNVEDLSSGMYVLKIENSLGQSFSSNKVILE